MQLSHQNMTNFFNFAPTLSHLHPLEVENGDRNSRLAVERDFHGQIGSEMNFQGFITDAVSLYTSQHPMLKER